jgi:isoleucyl-tRNA synthetase
MAESIYQNLVVGCRAPGAAESVHLVDWPTADTSLVDAALVRKMDAVRELVSLGLQVRTQAKAKVRQPLRTAHVVLSDDVLREGLAAAEGMIKDELNVLGLAFVAGADVDTFVTYRLKPNFRTLGQRGLGKEAQKLKKSLGDLPSGDAAKLLAEVRATGSSTFDGVTLSIEDLEVAFDTREGFSAAGGRLGVVALDTRLDDELRELGLVRELTNRVQNARKDAKLELADRIVLRVAGPEPVRAALAAHGARLSDDVLAVSLEVVSELPPEADPGEHRDASDVEGHAVIVALRKAP